MQSYWEKEPRVEVLAFGAVSAGDGGVGLGVSSDRAVCACRSSASGTVGACVGLSKIVVKGREWREAGSLPLGQSEQVPEPADENFPATHSSQSEADVPKVGFEKPASQV